MHQVEPKVYNATQVAQMFGVSASHVTRLAARDGHFHGCRVIRAIGRRVLFSKAAVDAVLSEYEARVDDVQPQANR